MKTFYSNEDILKMGKEFSRRYRITQGAKFQIKDAATNDITDRLGSKETARWRARSFLDCANQEMAVLQEKLYAQKTYALLVVLQAMDAAGKDGTIKHVMSGINPQGCDVSSFKTPSDEELAHTFLWRCALRLPEAGKIGIFNRSYYEDVLIQRVHPEFLQSQHLPPKRITRKIWRERYEDINAFEKHLTNNGVVVLKFYLHMSKNEQKKRFLKRIREENKNWKFSSGDIKERALWNQYMNAYENVVRATAKPWAPWYVIPADHKWYARALVAMAIIDTMESLDLRYPEIPDEQKKTLKDAQKLLKREK